MDGRPPNIAQAADPVTLDVPGGTVVQWEIIVKAFGINVSFSYTTASNATPKPINVEGSEGGVLKVQSDNGLTSGTFVMPEVCITMHSLLLLEPCLVMGQGICFVKSYFA